MVKSYPERLHEILEKHLNDWGLDIMRSMETEIALLIDEIITKQTGMIDVDGKKILIGDTLYKTYEGFLKIK